jgi:hypothetical protein
MMFLLFNFFLFKVVHLCYVLLNKFDEVRLNIVNINVLVLTVATTVAVIGITLGGIAVSLAAYAMLLH